MLEYFLLGTVLEKMRQHCSYRRQIYLSRFSLFRVASVSFDLSKQQFVVVHLSSPVARGLRLGDQSVYSKW
ncbi:hypothetical protein ASD63_16680 [Ensifer sp. Root558]|nr:hypothetical protein ASD63_16680 [Ensifer sp. Root558]